MPRSSGRTRATSGNSSFPTPTTRFSSSPWRTSETIRIFGLLSSFPTTTRCSPAVTRRCKTTLRSYDIIFPVLHAGHTYWIQETVVIHPIAEGWQLLGIDHDITSQYEKTLLQNQQNDLLQNLSQSDGCIVWHADVRGNDRTSKLTWKRRSLPSNFYDKLFAHEPLDQDRALIWDEKSIPELPKLSQAADDALSSGQAGYEQYFRIVTPGQTYWVHEKTSIQQQGLLHWHVIGVILDETRQRTAELERARTDLLVSNLLNQADCLLWQATVSRTDNPGVFERKVQSSFYWEFFIPHSELYDSLFGKIAPDSHRTLMWSENSVPELSEITRDSLHALDNDLPSYEHDFHYTSAAGRMFCLYEKATILRADAAHWNIVGVITDVTRQREMEDALAKEREQLAVILSAMKEGVIATDRNGAIKYVNASARSMLARGDEVIGAAIESLGVVRRPDQSIDSPVVQAITKGIPIDIPPTTMTAPGGGTPRVVEGIALPLWERKSQIAGAIVVIRDITEQQRIAQELDRAAKLEAVGLLAGGIAHDFNNILTIIIGNLSLMKIEDDPASRQACLHDAQLATERARSLTQQLLTFARGGEPVLASTNIADLIAEVTRFALHGTAIQCDFDFDPQLWAANADKGQIGQVVQNLVINASQAMPKGGHLHIATKNQATAEGPCILITIADTGVGISEADLLHLFEPYFTTKTRGNGLGLATVYSIIKKHKGQINVQSKTGQGTTFSILLPALPHTSAAAPSAQAPSHHFRGRVLFLDDESAIQRTTGAMLRQMGLEVTCVANKQAALQACQQARDQDKPFDLALMDLTIPGDVGGEETLVALRQIDPNLQAIVSSGYSQNPIMANHVAYGFQGIIPKPYGQEQLAAVLAQVFSAATRLRKPETKT